VTTLETPAAKPPRGGNVLTRFIERYATPLITGLFIVSAVSGTALFFHTSQSMFHEMHEWLSMLLLLPFVLHLWKNWRPLLNYAKRRTLIIPLVASLAIAVPFAVTGMTESHGGNPGFRTMSLLTQARLSDLAPILHTTPDALLAALKQHGYPAQSADETLDAIAAASGKPANEALFAVMPGR
jgi:hypothetical protein